MCCTSPFTFDPAWLPRRTPGRSEWLFQGHLISSRVQPETRRSLPDSLVVLTEDERLLTRSAAVLYVLRSLGGLWALVAALTAGVPPLVLDWCYDRVAVARKRVFGTRERVCPVLSAELKRRFEA